MRTINTPVNIDEFTWWYRNKKGTVDLIIEVRSGVGNYIATKAIKLRRSMSARMVNP